MGFSDRSDGVLLKKLPGFRKMFPYLMPTRTESVIYYTQRIMLEKTLAWLERRNQKSANKATVFHVILAAAARTLGQRPDANRFVMGRRIYQRRSIDLSFVMKRQLAEHAGETNIKMTFDPRVTVDEVIQQVLSVVSSGKKSETSADEKLCDLLTSLPRFLTRFLMWSVRVLDYFGMLPASFVKGDALYTSAFLANLGSIGLDAIYHHMFEWGNAGFLLVVGKRKKALQVGENNQPEVREVMDICFTLDERITDGVHYANTITMLTELIENPGLLEQPPASVPDPLAFA